MQIRVFGDDLEGATRRAAIMAVGGGECAVSQDEIARRLPAWRFGRPQLVGVPGREPATVDDDLVVDELEAFRRLGPGQPPARGAGQG